MELLIIVLNKTEFLNDLLSVLVEAGVTHATILDSEGMGHHLAYEVPIFAGLSRLVGEPKAHNKTILALIKDKTVVKELQKILKESNIDFSRSGTGIVFTIPVNMVIKSSNDIEE